VKSMFVFVFVLRHVELLVAIYHADTYKCMNHESGIYGDDSKVMEYI